MTQGWAKAKGYPDISTRAFLHLVSASHPRSNSPPPVYVFADFDPDGMAIMSTYKHGSWNLSHESSQLLVPCIQWLGIRSADLITGDVNAEINGLLRLSSRDRQTAKKMLENSAVFREDGLEGGWRRELQLMLMLNVKAEMEMLGERDGGVVGWVEGKLAEHGHWIEGPANEEGGEDSDEMLV
ncbi:endodeoxyribonuclease [Lecanora helva]